MIGRAILAAVVVSFAVAAPADATIVWKKGSDIWAANDDGSGARPIAGAFELGMSSLSEPHVAHNGDLVVFTGSTTRNNTNQNGTFHCGLNCAGLYRWQAGQIARLSPAPASSNGFASTFEASAEVATSGRIVYDFFGCSGYVGQFGTFSCENSLQDMAADGSGRRDFGATCADGAEQPSPNPANPAEAAYAGCEDANGDHALWVSGLGGSNPRLIGADDALIEAPSWRSDGQLIVDTEKGTQPGLWIVAGVGAPSHRWALGEPNGMTFDSPRFIGAAQDRVIFGAQGELWTIPASCTAATCSFPASATKLTSGGDNSQPAWTSRALSVPTTPPPAQPGPAQAQTQTNQTQPTQTQTQTTQTHTQTQGTVRPVTLSVPKARLRAALAKGLSLKVTPGERGRVTVTLKSGRKKVGSGKASVGARGTARVKAKFTRSAKRSLRRRKSLRLTVHVVFKPAAGGPARRGAKTVTIRR